MLSTKLYRNSLNLLAVLLIASTALIGCGEDAADGDHDDVYRVILVDRDTDEEIANYHGGHWHHRIELEAHSDEDNYESIGFEFQDEDDNELDIPLGDDGYDYDVELDDDTVAWTDLHSDHFHIRGDEEGDTLIYFDFTLDGDVFFDTRDEGLEVFSDDHDDNDHDELEVSHFELLDRAGDPHEIIADIHDDHWDGDFADGIELDIADDTDDYETAAAGDGEAVSLGAHAEEDHDGHTHDVDFDGDYEFDVGYAHDGDEDYVYLDGHGDHVHVVGTAEGHAHVVFQIVERTSDDVVWESPEFEFDVHD